MLTDSTSSARHSLTGGPVDNVAAQSSLLYVHSCCRLGRSANPPSFSLRQILCGVAVALGTVAAFGYWQVLVAIGVLAAVVLISTALRRWWHFEVAAHRREMALLAEAEYHSCISHHRRQSTAHALTPRRRRQPARHFTTRGIAPSDPASQPPRSVYRLGVRTLYASGVRVVFTPLEVAMAARSYPNPPGRPPKPESQRRRRNTPMSYGAAEPTTASAAEPAPRELRIDAAHPLVVAMWDTVQQSCEATFYSEADWERLRLELWHANRIMSTGRLVSSRGWAAVQSGLNEMLLSPAVKRRAGIEMRPDVDADKVAADEQIVRYKQRLKSV